MFLVWLTLRLHQQATGDHSFLKIEEALVTFIPLCTGSCLLFVSFTDKNEEWKEAAEIVGAFGECA